jgi:hypothetical protein
LEHRSKIRRSVRWLTRRKRTLGIAEKIGVALAVETLKKEME